MSTPGSITPAHELSRPSVPGLGDMGTSSTTGRIDDGPMIPTGREKSIPMLGGGGGQGGAVASDQSFSGKLGGMFGKVAGGAKPAPRAASPEKKSGPSDLDSIFASLGRR